MASWCIDTCPLFRGCSLLGVYSQSYIILLYLQNHRNSGFVEKKWTTLVKMCFYCFYASFYACWHYLYTWIFSSSAHKHPTICLLLLESIIWCTRIVCCDCTVGLRCVIVLWGNIIPFTTASSSVNQPYLISNSNLIPSTTASSSVNQPYPSF